MDWNSKEIKEPTERSGMMGGDDQRVNFKR